MEIKELGTPPYKVSNGYIPDLHAGNEQFSTAPDFLHALDILRDISENGEDKKPYVIDAKNQKVVDLTSDNGVQLLNNFITELQKGNIHI